MRDVIYRKAVSVTHKLKNGDTSKETVELGIKLNKLLKCINVHSDEYLNHIARQL